MKTIYFIRHGQSTGNVSMWEQQHSETQLTPQGQQQAGTVAEHMKRFPIQAILSSTFARAKATAGELSKALGLPVEYSDLFIERRRPSIQIKKPKMHPGSMWAQLNLVLFNQFSWFRYSDEETPADLLKRAHGALALIAARPEDTIIVVTHGRFMRALYAAMKIGEGVTGRMYLNATRHLHIRNTALMVATYDTNGWEVKAWNADAAEV